MTWKRHLYPDDWDQIANECKEATGWKCEHCGHPHNPVNGYTLTVHHLDGNPQNCEPENLVALCQVCHLHLQRTMLPGQIIMLFAAKPWMIGKVQIYDPETL